MGKTRQKEKVHRQGHMFPDQRSRHVRIMARAAGVSLERAATDSTSGGRMTQMWEIVIQSGNCCFMMTKERSNELCHANKDIILSGSKIKRFVGTIRNMI